MSTPRWPRPRRATSRASTPRRAPASSRTSPASTALRSARAPEIRIDTTRMTPDEAADADRRDADPMTQRSTDAALARISPTSPATAARRCRRAACSQARRSARRATAPPTRSSWRRCASQRPDDAAPLGGGEGRRGAARRSGCGSSIRSTAPANMARAGPTGRCMSRSRSTARGDRRGRPAGPRPHALLPSLAPAPPRRARRACWSAAPGRPPKRRGRGRARRRARPDGIGRRQGDGDRARRGRHLPPLRRPV